MIRQARWVMREVWDWATQDRYEDGFRAGQQSDELRIAKQKLNTADRRIAGLGDRLEEEKARGEELAAEVRELKGKLEAERLGKPLSLMWGVSADESEWTPVICRDGEPHRAVAVDGTASPAFRDSFPRWGSYKDSPVTSRPLSLLEGKDAERNIEHRTAERDKARREAERHRDALWIGVREDGRKPRFDWEESHPMFFGPVSVRTEPTP